MVTLIDEGHIFLKQIVALNPITVALKEGRRRTNLKGFLSICAKIVFCFCAIQIAAIGRRRLSRNYGMIAVAAAAEVQCLEAEFAAAAVGRKKERQ